MEAEKPNLDEKSVQSGAVAAVTPTPSAVLKGANSDMDEHKRITISDIARQAGVSKTAVSFAFNMPTRLSKKTAEHILTVAKTMGYAPNPIARSLNTRRTHAIGLLVPQDIPEVMGNPFFAELMRGIGEVCKAEGLSLMLVPPMRGSLVDATYAALVDGCIVTGLNAEDQAVKVLLQRKIPFVMIDTEAPPHIASVLIDDCRGAQLLMDHLLNKGHRTIAIASFWSGTNNREDLHGTLRQRFSGFESALRDHGLDINSGDIVVLECDASVDGGREVFGRIHALPQRPTAVICLSDAIAWGVIDAARAAHVAIPGQLAVVGFDDLPGSHLMHPALTTVRQPAIEKGRRAAQMFVELLRGNGNCEPQRVLLPVELVVRESSG
jgi:DNA-binding LacI/PurR family transcriptional regulator